MPKTVFGSLSFATTRRRSWHKSNVCFAWHHHWRTARLAPHNLRQRQPCCGPFFIPYQDPNLEQLYTYLRSLLTKLPRLESGPVFRLEDDFELIYYRLQQISWCQIDLSTGDGKPLKGPTDVETGHEDSKISLSELIDILNERFGADFTQADQLVFDQIQKEAIEGEVLKKAAAANSKADFGYVLGEAFKGLVID